MFSRPLGAQEDRKGQTAFSFAWRLWGWNTSQANGQGIQNQTGALGVFIQKTGLLWRNNLPAWQAATSESEIRNWTMFSQCFSAGISPCLEMFYIRRPCLLWALLVNKVRVTPTGLLLAFKAVCKIACKSGTVLYICQRRNARSRGDEWVVIRPTVSGS